MERAHTSGSMFREWEFWACLAVLVITYVVRFEAFPMVGEETRVARVTVEMFDRNDWVVPRELGQPFNSRPPLMFWLIAIPAWFVGEVNVFATRLPSILGVVLTGLLIYGYSRTWLARTGSLLAVLFWVTLPELLIANRKAEAEALFTMSVAASLIGWHAAYARGWSSTTMWVIGYSMAAFATLIKGPQAPIYFGVTTWLFLAHRRDWRRLLCTGHLLGMMSYAVLVGSWVALYCSAEGVNGFIKLWTGDSAMRFQNQTAMTFLIHLVVYPAEIFGCMLPWSILLLAYLWPQNRQAADSAAGHRTFLLLGAIVGFLPCWLTPGAVSRYYQPLYPLLVVLMAWPVDRLVSASASRRPWRLFVRFLAIGPIVVWAVLMGLMLAANQPRIADSITLRAWVQPVGLLAVLGILAAIACWQLWQAAETPARIGVAMLAFAVFTGLFATTAWVDAIRARAVPLDVEVARIKQDLPPGQPAYYIDYIHHRFVYYNHAAPKRIEAADVDRLKPGECVCVTCDARAGNPFGDRFEVVGSVSMDRLRDRRPEQIVLVLQRVADRHAIAFDDE